MKQVKSLTNSLEITAISKKYQRGKMPANDQITTSFHPGQITAVIGHNGAGKTTLLNQIIGTLKPDNGDITYQGYSLLGNTKLARTLVSMMPQFHAPLTGVTLRQSIEAIVYIRCVTEKQVKIRTNQILADLSLEQWADQSGDKLSGGVQRLTSFAMAVVCPPPIILLDEPTNDVDPVRRKLVWQYMRKLAQKGHIIVIVTHNLLEVEAYADRFLLFEHGKLIQDTPTGELSSQFATHTLSAVIHDKEVLTTAPEALEMNYLEKEARVVFTLTSEQIIEAITWLLKMMDQGKVMNYKLSSASLDITYGGMTNEQ